MIRLHPIPDANHVCPYCQVRLKVKGWYIPGMRNLADLECSQCKREFYGDLPTSQALYTPLLLEKATGVVHDKYEVRWFAKWFRDSYANRVNLPIGFTVEEFRPLGQAILLNCLDTLYGHCLLKLLNAQYYLDHLPDFDLIVLVPRFLRWMVPDGVAAIWTVDLPLKRGIEWNDWLAAELKRRIEPLKMCWLSIALPHPHPDDYKIERFTRVCPFPIEEWDTRLKQPTVTFIWREDRIWQGLCPNGILQKLAQRLKLRLAFVQQPLDVQRQQVVAMAQTLRQTIAQIDFAVVGLGRPGGFPHWIEDLRSSEINNHVERIWCERYAQSHLVIGVHGSNMLLPSAHAGAVIELIPPERFPNILQDILLRPADSRETLFRYRIVPISIHPYELATLVVSLLRDHGFMMLNMGREFCRHEIEEVLSISDRRALLSLQL